jgi:hypothetical protein
MIPPKAQFALLVALVSGCAFVLYLIHCFRSTGKATDREMDEDRK